MEPPRRCCDEGMSIRVSTGSLLGFNPRLVWFSGEPRPTGELLPLKVAPALGRGARSSLIFYLFLPRNAVPPRVLSTLLCVHLVASLSVHTPLLLGGASTTKSTLRDPHFPLLTGRRIVEKRWIFLAFGENVDRVDTVYGRQTRKRSTFLGDRHPIDSFEIISSSTPIASHSPSTPRLLSV
jgi:hypothetical protein